MSLVGVDGRTTTTKVVPPDIAATSIAASRWPTPTPELPARSASASVTCGQGITQIMTALAMAESGNAPLGVRRDAPIGDYCVHQSIDQAAGIGDRHSILVPSARLIAAPRWRARAFYVARPSASRWCLAVPFRLATEEFLICPTTRRLPTLCACAGVLGRLRRPRAVVFDEHRRFPPMSPRPNGRSARQGAARGSEAMGALDP